MSNRYDYTELLDFSTSVFKHIGLSDQDAYDAAFALMWASVRGVDTHGIRNIKRYYVDGIHNGSIRRESDLEIERETPIALATNAKSAMGLVAGTRGMQLAIEKAKSAGAGFVTIRQSQHFGAAGVYAFLAAEQDMIGISMTGYMFHNGQSRCVLPFGGKIPMFSTNPIAFACPVRDSAPFVLDMATSVVPINRMELMQERGEPIPEGWGLDVNSQPTNVPELFDGVMPLGGMERLGGHKGFGLMMMVQILTGVLSSGWRQLSDPEEDPVPMAGTIPKELDDRTRPLQPVESRGSLVLGDRPEPRYGYAQEGVAQFFAAIRIDQFMDPDMFKDSMKSMIRCINDCPPAPGFDKVRVAGQPEEETMADRMANGVPLEPSAIRDLKELEAATGISMPQPQ